MPNRFGTIMYYNYRKLQLFCDSILNPRRRVFREWTVQQVRQLLTVFLIFFLIGLMVYHGMTGDGTCKLAMSIKGIKVRNERWQVVSNGREEMMLYRAYYDDRYDLMGYQYVRVLTVTAISSGTVYCQLWYEASRFPHVVQATPTFMGDWSNVNGATYREVMYNCKLDGGSRRPMKVSLSLRPCTHSSSLLPVVQPDKARSGPFEQEVGICVPASMKQLNNPHRIVEWVETNRMFGVSEIHVYYNSLQHEVKRVLEHYQNEGFMHLHYHPLPFDVVEDDSFRSSSLISINDCMYRNMYRLKYMVVLDTEENVIPRLDYNYKQMLNRIDTGLQISSAPSYTFKNAYFWFDFAPIPNVREKLQSLQYRKRVSLNLPLFGGKSFLDPRKCLSVFNHFCNIKIPQLGSNWTVEVHPNIALTHHYKKCNFEPETCERMVSAQEEDDTMLRFQRALRTLYQTQIKQIGLE